LAYHFRGLSTEQLRRVISNVKGIFREKFFANAENKDGDPIKDVISENTN
jgi:hypothetical protein